MSLSVCHYFSAAYNVQLRDATFPPTDFQVLSGMAEVKWDKIPAGSNVSHALVLVPLRPGYFNFTSADVTYKVSENAEEVQVCRFFTHVQENIRNRHEAFDYFRLTYDF